MTDTRETLTVIIPCYNEENGVGPTVSSVLSHAKRLPVDVRVVMIDDGSTDRTRERMEEIAREHPECVVIANDANRGLGRAVLGSYDRIKPRSWVTVLPGDNELAFESIDNYLRVRDQYDVILGYLQNPVIRTLGRRLASWSYTKIVATIYGFPWRYLNGMKMYRLEAFKDIEVVSSGHAFAAELLAKAQLRQPSLRIGEVPFVARGRKAGKSKAMRPRSVVRAVLEVMRGASSVAKYRREVIVGPGDQAITGSTSS